jgi:dTMP kinase
VATKRGFLITFEGIEGCGKSTAIIEAQHYLSVLGRTALLTREPGGTWLGESLRAIILDTPDDEDIDATEEAFLFCASRAAHTRKIIGPALKAGCDVVSDRYLDSTFVYQGVKGGLANDELDFLNRIATRGIKPDLTILLDLPVESGLARKRGDGVMNRIDKKELTFHQAVRERFLALAAVETERITIVNSSGSRAATTKEIQRCIDGLLKPDASQDRPSAK